MPSLDEPETAGAAGDLRELPREQVTPLLAVELRRLGEEERLARGSRRARGRRCHAHVRGAGDESLDLLAPGRERHRPVENRDAARVQSVHLAREREHGAAAERDDDGSGCERPQCSRADELERELPLEDLQLVRGERAVDEGSASRASRRIAR